MFCNLAAPVIKEPCLGEGDDVGTGHEVGVGHLWGHRQVALKVKSL